MQQPQPRLSHFASQINHPICQFLDQIKTLPCNSSISPVSFLSGDPTVYGQTQFQMPSKGYQIIKQHALKQNQHGYNNSLGIATFRKQIANLYKGNIQLNINDIHINAGVNMGLLACLLAITNQGDQVLVPQLGYPFYQNLCPALNRKTVPYRLLKDKNFQIDLDHLSTLITPKTSFMLVINPANPSGAVFSRKHMQQILQFSNKNQLLLVCDQVYFKMVFPGIQALSFGQVTQDVPVICLCGVEKILSVPGWVQSWTALFDKHSVLDQIRHNLEVLATIFLHTNTFTQFGLVEVLREVGVFTQHNMGEIEINHNNLAVRFQKHDCLKVLPAQGTIYLAIQIDFTKLKDIHSDMQFAVMLRKEKNVNLMPLSVMGTGVQGFRMLTCASKQLYDNFFARLEEFLQQHSNK